MNIFNKNFFNKYRSHYIASIGTLAFLGLILLLLFAKPFWDSSSAGPDASAADMEIPLQFQNETKDDVPPMPSPATNPNTQPTPQEQVKGTQSGQMTASKEVEEDPNGGDVSVTPSSAKEDSILIAELKKEIVDIKNLLPDDSLPKDKTPQKTTPPPPQKVLATTDPNFYEERQFYYNNYRAIMSLKKVYPYVQKTKELVAKMNAKLATIKDNKERRKLIKETEKELFTQFEKDVRNMSTSQGRLLLKLISRETDQTAYGLIKTYKGGIPATFWYGVGLLFHENLKMQYDSLGEDAQLEKIVKRYKMGKL